MIPYRAMLDVPAELLQYLSGLLAAERHRRGTPARSRKLACRDQAILALRWFRDRTRIEAPGRDHGVSRATACRYVAETVTSVKGEEIDAWYSGKAHRHGGNVQAVMRPGGLPLRAGPAEPGSVHDITAARRHALPALYRAAALGMPCLVGSGCEGAGIGIHVPVKNLPGNQEPDTGTRTRNALLRDLRCRGERGLALLTQR